MWWTLKVWEQLITVSLLGMDFRFSLVFKLGTHELHAIISNS